MTWYQDLSTYAYGDDVPHDRRLVNVGWLARGRPFPTAPPTEALVEALYRCAMFPTAMYRGLHACDLCKGRDVDDNEVVLHGRALMTGDGEIRVRGATFDYAAPTLVVHYVAVHQYAPPAGFVEAVLRRANELPVVWGEELARLEQTSEDAQSRLVDDLLQKIRAEANANAEALEAMRHRSSRWEHGRDASVERLEALEHARFLAERWHEDAYQAESSEEWTRMTVEIIERSRAAGLIVHVPEPTNATG